MASDESKKDKPDANGRARDKSGADQDADAIELAREKIPEGEGNLRRRADWFQKRTGGSE